MKNKLFSCLAFVIISHLAAAQTTEQIIESHINAVGNLATWQSIKTITIDGKIVDGSTTIKYKKQIIPSMFMRLDYAFETRNINYQNKKYFTIITPKDAWRYAPEDKEGEIVKLNEAEKLMAYKDMEFEDPFVFADIKKITITRLGDEIYNDENHYKFLLQYPSGRSYYVYLNAKSYFIDKRVLVDQDITEIIEYKTHEKTKIGITIPKQIFQKDMEYTIEQVKFNEPMPEKLFK